MKQQGLKKVFLLSGATLFSVNAFAAVDTDRAHELRPAAETATVSSDAVVVPQEFSFDDFAGFTYRDKLIFDLDGVESQIWTGFTVGGNSNTVTYGFANGDSLPGLYNNPNYGFTAGNGLAPFTAQQEDEARDAIAFWDDLIAPSFVEKNGKGARIQFANSIDPGQAYAYYPEYGFTNAQGWKFFSDIFVADPEVNWTNKWFGNSGYGVTTLVHEIGHSLGLSHPGAYNGAGATDYEGQAEYAQDSTQYSVMSYWSASETGARIVDWGTLQFSYAQAPLVHDILAVQAAYGADETTRAGDTVYGFNSTADRDIFDFSQNPYPYLSIYDAGGNDTLDLSGFNESVYVNLNEGAFSSVGQTTPDAETHALRRAEISEAIGFDVGTIPLPVIESIAASYRAANAADIEFETGVPGIETAEYDNLSIAYGTVIENAIGGPKRDLLRGNDADNRLQGNAGDDIYQGGLGADTFVLNVVESGDYILDFNSGEDKIDLSGTGVAFSYSATPGFTGVAGELFILPGILVGDADGDTFADLIVFYNGNLQSSDLIL